MKNSLENKPGEIPNRKIISARVSTEGNRDGLTWSTAPHSKEKSRLSIALFYTCSLEATKKAIVTLCQAM